MSPESQPIIDCENVRKTFHVRPHDASLWQQLRKKTEPREVLKSVSLQVNKGDVFALLGSSGSGKSTMLRCINRLEKIDSGTIKVNGETIGVTEKNGRSRVASAKELARQRAEVSMVFQHFNLFPNKTAIENISAPLRAVRRLSREQAEHEAMQMLERVGLVDRASTYPDRLSGGQKQRVAIARALAMKPHALLFDEPTSSLDPELVAEVLQVIRSIADEGTTMIIVTHEMSFARTIADQILVMDDGRIVEQGPPEEIFNNPQHKKTKILFAGLK